MQKWEYKIVRVSGSKDVVEMVPSLNDTGNEGWELVSVVISPIPIDRRTQYLAFFKRPVV
jgi:hypothetical protein